MKTFKEFLTEDQRSHTVKSLVFGEGGIYGTRGGVYIPLSLPMWKRITDVKKMYGVHSTSIDGVEKLLRKQRTAAQVSTTDTASEAGIRWLSTGVATDGGAVALLKGDAAFEADDDIYSFKDKQTQPHDIKKENTWIFKNQMFKMACVHDSASILEHGNT